MLFTTMIPTFVSAAELLKTDKTTYTEGEEILVTATGSGNDWVGLYLATDTPESDQSIRWYYVARDGNVSGGTKDMRQAERTNSNRSAYFSVPAGEYIIYLFENDGYTVLDSVSITVNEDPAANIPPDAPTSAEYERTGAFVGAADGKLSITVANEEALPDSYKAYWADKNGALADYTAFAPIKCTGKVTEYEMVASTLIPTTADRILVYAVRNGKMSESAATVMLPEGCNDYDFGSPLYEMQVLSDIHLNASQTHIHNMHFATALEDIKKLSPNSIGIFINGDIADSGSVSEYRCFRQLLSNAGSSLPSVYCAIGNHDLANGPYDTHLKNFLQYTEPGVDSVYYDLWLNGVHFIFLGSESFGLQADLSTTQLNWFKEKLNEDRDENRPIYVFLHQGIIDTVAGTFAYQEWHGIKQSRAFAKILKDYPEVVLFTGHSHWEMDSLHTMKPRDDKLPTIFNTAAGAYLWNDDSIETNQGIEGSQGYYIYAYKDKLIVRGRDYVTGQWIASAQFIVDFPQSEEEEPIIGDDIVTPEAPPSNKSVSSYIKPVIGIGIGALVIAAGVSIALAVTKKRKSKSKNI